MQEESEARRRDNSINRKEDGEKQMLSRLLSWFFSSKNKHQSTRDQVLKPMHEIVSDVASELVETTIESIDDTSIDKTLNEVQPVRQSQPQRNRLRRSRFLRGILNLFQKNRNSTMSSIGLAARLNETGSDDSEMDERPEAPRKGLWEKPSSWHNQVHRITRPSFLSFPRRMKRYDSASSVAGIESSLSSVQFAMDDSYTDSDDTSLLHPATLGVNFPHPVYASKCRLLAAEDKRPDFLWTRTNPHVTPDMDEHTFLPAKAYTDTKVDDYSQYSLAKAYMKTRVSEAYRSVVSSSLYPSDEEKDHEDGNLYYGSFDSDDIPFDEIFTDASFFDMGYI